MAAALLLPSSSMALAGHVGNVSLARNGSAKFACVVRRASISRRPLTVSMVSLHPPSASEAKRRLSFVEADLPSVAPNHLHAVHEKEGQSPWIDNLTREWLISGHLKELVTRGVRGLTSNPSIFEKAISSSDVYDGNLKAILEREGAIQAAQGSEAVAVDMAHVEAAYWEMAKQDIMDTADALADLYSASNGMDGFVSLEVSPLLAYNTSGTVEMARSLNADVARQNLMVKIPATSHGLPAIRQMIAEGVSINATLIFTLSRYEQVIDAYINGLEDTVEAAERNGSDTSSSPVENSQKDTVDAAERNGSDTSSSPVDLSRVASVASFFLSRMDAVVDKRLETIGTEEAVALKGEAAVAQAVMAYELFKRKFDGPRWSALQQHGARVQRPLWASTGVKDRSYSPTKYVNALIGPHTVNTMPDETLKAFATHGTVARTIDADVDAARDVVAKLEALGINLEEIGQALETDGVEKFVASFDGLLSTLHRKALLLNLPGEMGN